MAVYYIRRPTCHPKRLEAPDGHDNYEPKIEYRMNRQGHAEGVEKSDGTGYESEPVGTSG